MIKRIALFFPLFISVQVMAQGFVEEAIEYMQEGSFYVAETILASGLDNPKLDKAARGRALHLQGTCLQKTHQYAEAAQVFHSLFLTDSLQNYPRTLLHLGTMYKQAGEYALAKVVFEGSQRFYSDTDERKLRTELEIKSVNFALQSTAAIVDLPTNALPLNTGGNELSCRAYDKASWAFTRLNKETVENQLWAMTWKPQTGYRVDPHPFRTLNKLGNVANPVFSPDHKHVLFSRCSPQGCALWMADLEKGQFVAPRPIPNLGRTGANYSHPSVHKINEKVVLLFSSDDTLIGAQGYDLFYAEFQNGVFVSPQKVKTASTIGNEITPYYFDGWLYFASDLLPGFGGFDVHKIEWEGGREIINLGYPVNTSANDLYYSLFDDGKKYLLTSNRLGVKTSRGLNCCNDVFMGDLPIQDYKEVPVNYDSLHIAQYLPLTLYFHNDEPHPRSTQIFATERYTHSLNNYLKKRQEYVRKTGDGSEQIQVFFDQREADFKALRKVLEAIKTVTAKGKIVQLWVQGHASPLSNNQYNFNLSHRRIDSFRKEVAFFGLKSELDQGLIQLRFSPQGEERSPEYVEDNPQKNASIYNLSAMLERRIEFKKVNVLPYKKSVR